MIKLQVKYWFCCLFLLFLGKIKAQEKENNLGFKASHHFGFIAPHSELVNEIIKGHVNTIQFDLFKQVDGSKLWEQYYNYPRIGISALFIDAGNPESLGYLYGFFPFIDFPLNHKKISWDIKFGTGLGFVSRPFNRKNNYKNMVIGSHLNALIYFDTHCEIPVTNRLHASTGIALTHFSNGSLKRPNLGINMFTLNYGLSYNFGNTEKVVVETIENREKHWSHIVVANGGVKEIDPIGGKKYFIYNASYNLMRTVSNKSSLGIGADYFYNSSLEPLILRNQHEELGVKGNIRLGLSGIYSLDIGKVSMLFQTGYYGYTKSTSGGHIYTRVGTRYHFSNHLFFNLNLKTHFFVADFIEYGIGYQINSSKKK